MPDFLTGGFGGLASGVLGSIGSIWQNKTNLKIARETNAMNRQMFDDQLAYNTEMWNKQNEYNDPLAQRQRLENAGLNPLFFGLDGTGNASGWQSATPIPAQGASIVNPLQSLGAGVGDMVNQQKTASERDFNFSKSKTEDALRNARLNLTEKQSSKLAGEIDELSFNIEHQQERFDKDMEYQNQLISDLKNQAQNRNWMSFATVNEMYNHREDLQMQWDMFVAQLNVDKARAYMEIGLSNMTIQILTQQLIDAPLDTLKSIQGIDANAIANLKGSTELIYLAEGLALNIDILRSDASIREKDDAYYALKSLIGLLTQFANGASKFR